MNEPADPKTIIAGFTFAGVGIGWLIGLFRYGRKIGRQDQLIESIVERVQTVEARQKEAERQWQIDRNKFRAEVQIEVKAIHTLIEGKIAAIEAYFWDGERNPRILTVSQHEKICGDRKEDMLEIKGHVEEIFKTMSTMGENIAVVSDRFMRGNQ